MFTLSVLTLPFIQLGISFHASVAALLAVFLLAFIKNYGAFFRHALSLRVVIPLIMVGTAVLHEGGDSREILRALREGVFLFLMCGASVACVRGMDEQAILRTFKLIFFTSVAMLVFVLVQSYHLHQHNYWGIPQSLFVHNTATLPGELDLIYSDIRPSGTFGEPSYLGAYCLTLLFAMSAQGFNTRQKKATAGILLTITLLSRSLSGPIFCALYVLLSVLRYTKNKKNVLIAFLLTLIIGVGVLVTDNPLSKRMDKIMAGEDLSIQKRVIDPIINLPGFIVENPLGTSRQVFIQMADNGLLNILMFYGLVGAFLILPLILYTFRDPQKFFFFLCLSVQNGDLLSVDKFCLLLFGLLLFNTMSQLYESTTIRAMPPKNFLVKQRN